MMKHLLMTAAAAAFSFGLAAMDLPVQNSDFVETNGKLTGWTKSVQTKIGDRIAVEPIPGEKDDFAIVLSSNSGKSWPQVWQRLVKVSDLPAIPAGKTMVIELEYKQKTENVTGYAFGTLAFFDAKGKRLMYKDGIPLKGTNDWQERKTVFRVKQIPQGAATLGIAFYLGKSTGRTWFADPDLEVEIK